MSTIEEQWESECRSLEPSQKEESLVREVKVNLAHLHRKIDIMSAQVNRKLDSIMTLHDGSSNSIPKGAISCLPDLPDGIPNLKEGYSKEGYKQANKTGAGAMSGKCRSQPLPLPAASYLKAEVEDAENPNRWFSLGEVNPDTPEYTSKGNGTQEGSGRTSRPAEVIGVQIRRHAKRASEPAVIKTFSRILEPSKNRRLKWHQRVLNFLEEPDSSSAAFIYSKVVSTAILCSCVLNFAQTIKPPTLNPDVFVPIEMLCDGFFLGEVIVRFLATPNKLGFFTSYHNCIDVLSSGPAMILRFITRYTPYRSSDAADDIRYVILCISPVFRMLKMLRRWKKFNLLMYSGISLVSEVMPVLLVILFILTFTFSSLIYFVEPRDNIDALPKALWFTIITMSTVGYGDVVPKTTYGNIITLVLVICSALYMAVPLGIAGNAFSKVWDDRDWLLLIKYMHDRLTLNNYQASDIPNLFRTFGNDNGEIALDDFVRMISEMELGIREDRILDLFFSFDSDNSGTIDSMEFVRVIFPSQFVQMYGRTSERLTRQTRHATQSESLRFTTVATTTTRDRGRSSGSEREVGKINSSSSTTTSAFIC